MKITHWIIVASFIAPLFACSSSDSEDPAATGGTGGGAAGTGAGGSVVPTGGTGGGTAGTGGSTAGTGGSTAGTGGGTAGTGGNTSTSQCTLDIADNPTCTGCFQDKCETQCVGVMTEATVNDYIGCYQGCSDQTCMDGCDSQYPAASAAYGAFDDCLADQCPDECGGSCMMKMNDADCDTCFKASCSTQCDDYSALPNAQPHFDCYTGCEDKACQEGCAQQYPDEGAAIATIFECLGDNCYDECGISNVTSDCGMVAGNDQTCTTCFDEKCFDSCKAVADHADVSAYLTCANGCADQACVDGCDTTYPEMAALYTAFDTCITDNCATECAAD